MFEVLYPNGEVKSLEFQELCKGKKTILYFYPKDNTKGCTLEAVSFSEKIKDFEKLGYQVIGVSKDSIKSHQKFKEKYDLKIPLVSDPELILHKKFDVRGEKTLYGRKYMGTIRSTFVLNENCEVVEEFRNVKVLGHVENLLKIIEKLNN